MCAGRGISWLELPAVQRRQNAKVSGKPNVDWVRYTLEHYFEGRLPLARCLSLGCGRGGLERRLAEYQAFVACDAHDLSKHLITEAQRLAQETGYDHIHYEVHDANRIQLPRAHYDIVWAVNILHHVERLEHLYSQIAASLKRGGLFILKEYVGPNRFQFSARQRQIIRSC